MDVGKELEDFKQLFDQVDYKILAAATWAVAILGAMILMAAMAHRAW